MLLILLPVLLLYYCAYKYCHTSWNQCCHYRCYCCYYSYNYCYKWMIFNFSIMDSGPLNINGKHIPFQNGHTWPHFRLWLIFICVYGLSWQPLKDLRKTNLVGAREPTLFQLVLWSFPPLFCTTSVSVTVTFPIFPIPITAQLYEALSWLNLLGSLSDLFSKQHVFIHWLLLSMRMDRNTDCTSPDGWSHGWLIRNIVYKV